jgi:type III restriction enzyme
MATDTPTEIPLQPVDKPVICNPYLEPDAHWEYDRATGAARKALARRPAGYWYKTDRTGSAVLQSDLFGDEQHDDLPLVNRLRDDVRRWRESGYRGASNVTRELLHHWARADAPRRLFFCQREAVETLIYLAELRLPRRSSLTQFKNFEVTDADIRHLLAGDKPTFDAGTADFYPTLCDQPADPNLLPLRRMACKMATGSGKTVVMAMLIAWAFCNRGTHRASREYPNAVLVCCPNLTVKERLQVLRPEVEGNYYAAFDLVPMKYRPLLQTGKVLVMNWHGFAPESEHKEGDKTWAVVNKGPETREVFAERILQDLAERMPILVLNDEGHHCWRPAPDAKVAGLSGEAKAELDEEIREATVWIEGLDKLNNALGNGERGIALCVDLSATPFYIQGSGHPEGRPFPWIVSDFGLVDAIESGLVKIPRLPVQDTTGRPDPLYFRLWEGLRGRLQPGEFLPGRAKKPKPEVVYREAQGALLQMASQWVERFRQIQEATPGQEQVPPVLILVCDNTDIAEVFYRKISGEEQVELVTQADVEAVEAGDSDAAGNTTSKRKTRKKTKPKSITVYGKGEVYPEFFSNTAETKHTIRIDSKLLAEAESEDPTKRRSEAAEALRRVVATVGKAGEPGEPVRCVVSVSMLTEGWDANNVTQILGLRAFGSQLLCEQVVGRGLRRMDYTPDPETGLLTEEYVDVYGIPFSVIPYKGRKRNGPPPEDRPKNHVKADPARAAWEMRFPVVEGYAFALVKNQIRCDIDAMEGLQIEPNQEPTATFVRAAVGYQVGPVSKSSAQFGFEEQNRANYYAQTHLQTIQFEIARMIVRDLEQGVGGADDRERRVLQLKSRHQLFPQVYRFVQAYTARKVDFKGLSGQDRCELGLQKYVERIVERIRDGIVPDDSAGEPPLLPLLNRYQPIGTTADVNFKTTRPVHATVHSHIDHVVLDTDSWEASVAFRLELCVNQGTVRCYARNDGLGLVIPYEYMGIAHNFGPDFLVRLNLEAFDLTLLLEVKGYEDDKTKAKHGAAKRWVAAVNNWGKLGRWAFHVCRDPTMLEREIAYLCKVAGE